MSHEHCQETRRKMPARYWVNASEGISIMQTTSSLRPEHAEVTVVDSRPEDYGRLAASSAARGMLFQFATSISDALKLRHTAARSIWLVNLHLPDGSGCDLAAIVRARDPHTVVYLVGDEYDAAEELKARMEGGALYVCKPAERTWLSSMQSSPRPVVRSA